MYIIGGVYTVRIKKKVIHIQRPIVLKSIDLKICMWHISKEQLILFPLVPFLHQVCYAWPSTLPLKMTMSWPTFCKFSYLGWKTAVNAVVGNSDGWVPCYSHDTLKLHFESLDNHCKLSRFVLVMIGRIIFCLGPFMHQHLQHIHLWFQHKHDSNGECPEGPILPWPDRCPNIH